MEISIKSDGTRKGTSLAIDGVEVEDLTSLWFDVDSWCCDASFSYSTTEDDTEKGLKVSKTYRYDPKLAEASERPFLVKAEESYVELQPGVFDNMGERS